MNQHRFQVDLRGIIDLLANHLYSTPRVFVRELLQNAIDAIHARQALEPAHTGAIDIEVVEGQKGAPPTLVFRDNGVGLTEPEVHDFLSTIGASSKRGALEALRRNFLGQFGIGLLSCFLVADEVVLITRSARPGSPALEWTGCAEGTYRVRALDGELVPGTTVYLRAREDRTEFFERARIEELTREFGGLLPVPIRMHVGGRSFRLNEGGAPWKIDYASWRERDSAMRRLCREQFSFDPIEWLPLHSEVGEAEGVAFVLGKTTVASRPAHRVYLKNMLLTENATDILPSWAQFVRCVVNVNDLRPTASREALYEDERLHTVRRAFGRSIKRFLVRLAQEAPGRLRQVVSAHQRAMMALALEDDEFFRLVVAWIPFETSSGVMTLEECRAESSDILHTRTDAQFRELASLATARGVVVVNGGHTYGIEFIEKFARLDPDVRAKVVDPLHFIGNLADAPDELETRLAHFVEVADQALAPHGCRVKLKHFAPAELAALYVLSEEVGFERSIGVAKEKADGLWSEMMDQLREAAVKSRSEAVLCVNARNPLVESLAQVSDRKLLRLTAEILYVQALLMGHHPLRPAEMAVLNRSLIDLLRHGIAGARG